MTNLPVFRVGHKDEAEQLVSVKERGIHIKLGRPGGLQALLLMRKLLTSSVTLVLTVSLQSHFAVRISQISVSCAALPGLGLSFALPVPRFAAAHLGLSPARPPALSC